MFGWPVRMLAFAALLGLVWLMAAPSQALAHHRTYISSCPDPITEGESGYISATRPGTDSRRKISIPWFTYSATAVAGQDFVLAKQQLQRGRFGQDTVTFELRTMNDDIPEPSETFRAGFWSDRLWHGCDEIVIVDDDVPTLQSVTAPTPADGRAFRVGEVITLSAVFSGPVELTVPEVYDQRPGISLYLDGDHGWRPAKYAGGSGTDTLRFEYTVAVGDRDADGVQIGASPQIGGDTLKVAGYDVPVRSAYGGGSIDYQVDGGRLKSVRQQVVSAPANGVYYREGEFIDIEVEFNAPVKITGTPFIAINVWNKNWGSDQRHLARYIGGNATRILTYRFEVVNDMHDDDGISIEASIWTAPRVTGEPGGEVMAVRSDEPADQTWPPQLNLSGQAVDSRAYVTAMEVISSPASNNGGYAAGEQIRIATEWNANMNIGGDVTLDLMVGDELRHARYHSGTWSDRLVFAYTVQKDDLDYDGFSIPGGGNGSGFTVADGPADYLERYGGGNGFNPRYAGQANLADHKVDGVIPSVSSVEIDSDPGADYTYALGDLIMATATFSEDVTVTGTPQLELDLGGAARTASYYKTYGENVVFSYTVAVGDVDADGIAIGASKLNLNGGAIQDAAGNDATLTHDAVAADSGHQVSAPGGL